MSAAHTPGRWGIQEAPYGGIAITQPNHWEPVAVVYVSNLPVGQGHANARLIAAAPELLEVCELMLDFYGLDTPAFVAKHGHGISTRTIGNMARLVIARVREPEAPDGL